MATAGSFYFFLSLSAGSFFLYFGQSTLLAFKCPESVTVLRCEFIKILLTIRYVANSVSAKCIYIVCVSCYRASQPYVRGSTTRALCSSLAPVLGRLGRLGRLGQNSTNLGNVVGQSVRRLNLIDGTSLPLPSI